MARSNSRLTAVLIEDCNDVEKAIHYVHDVAMTHIGLGPVKIYYHVETPYGHVFVVGKKALAVRKEMRIE